MSNASDLVGSLVDLFWEIGQQRSIAEQARKSATLEERVQHLEQQQDKTYQLLRELMLGVGGRLGDKRLLDAVTGFGAKEDPKPPQHSIGQSNRDGGEANAPGDNALNCLACGAPIGDNETKCKACGWSYS